MRTMNHRRLPIGIQSFRRIREGNFYYVDKTGLIGDLIERGDHYFLARPRRFGKSLLIDTLQALFSGKEALFRGLGIHGRWNWPETNPVVRLSFDGKYNEPGDLKGSILAQLALIEEDAGLDPAPESLDGPNRLQRLLVQLHRQAGKPVVVLVDEYDKPILDVLEDPELARANRDYLRGFYGIVKGSAEHVRFVFVTGISMFSKVSLFSRGGDHGPGAGADAGPGLRGEIPRPRRADPPGRRNLRPRGTQSIGRESRTILRRLEFY